MEVICKETVEGNLTFLLGSTMTGKTTRAVQIADEHMKAGGKVIFYDMDSYLTFVVGRFLQPYTYRPEHFDKLDIYQPTNTEDITKVLPKLGAGDMVVVDPVNPDFIKELAAQYPSIKFVGTVLVNRSADERLSLSGGEDRQGGEAP